MYPFWKNLWLTFTSSRHRKYQRYYFARAVLLVNGPPISTTKVSASVILFGQNLFCSTRNYPRLIDPHLISEQSIAGCVDLNFGLFLAIYEHTQAAEPQNFPGDSLRHYKLFRESNPLEVRFDLKGYTSAYYSVLADTYKGWSIADPIRYVRLATAIAAATLPH